MPLLIGKLPGEVDHERSEKRQNILESAWELFTKSSYEKTSVNAIVKHAGMSKGAFYHYFNSKTELLRALSEHHNRKQLESLIPLLEDESIPAIEKINRWLNAAQTWKKKNFKAFMETSRIIYRDENAQLRRSLAEMRIRVFHDRIAKVIEQGVKEGVFTTKYPSETAEMFLWILNGFGEISSQLLIGMKDRPENRELIERQIEVFFSSLDSFLGAPDGSIERPDPKYTKMLYEVFGG